MDKNVCDTILQTKYSDGKIVFTDSEQEKIIVWIFTIQHMLRNSDAIYVPSCKKTEPGSKSIAPTCRMGKKCFHVYVYSLLKNFGLLHYNDEQDNGLTPDVYENHFQNGVCGCSFRHEISELMEMDKQIMNLLSEEKYGKDFFLACQSLSTFIFSVDESKTRNGFATNIIRNTVNQVKFPHFKMNEIFVYPDQIKKNSVISSASISKKEAEEAIIRLKRLGPKPLDWLGTATDKVKEKDWNYVPEHTIVAATSLPNTAKKSFAEVVLKKESQSPVAESRKTKAQLELEEEELRQRRLQQELEKVKNEQKKLEENNKMMKERAKALRVSNDAAELEIKKLREAMSFL